MLSDVEESNNLILTTLTPVETLIDINSSQKSLALGQHSSSNVFVTFVQLA